MSTTKKTIVFTTDLAPRITITNGYMAVYRIMGEEPTPIANAWLTQTTFEIEFDVDDNLYYYAVARIDEYSLNGGAPIKIDGEVRGFSLLSVFSGTQQNVSISAKSTIASAFAFNNFITLPQNIYIAQTPGTPVAYAMKNNFIKDDGSPSVIEISPNGLETNSLSMFNSLAALIYYCSIDDAFYSAFLDLTSRNSPETYRLIGGLMHLIRNPFDNVGDIYNLISDRDDIFLPSLKTMPIAGLPAPLLRSPIPNQWTLTVKVNRSGADNFLISGPAFVVFDKDNKAWIANNFRAGTPNSGTHCIVLNPDGTPCDFSPLTGGGLLGCAFGAAVNPEGNTVAIGNFGWGPKEYNPQFGSVSVFDSDGKVQCPPDGFVKGLSRVQGMCYDKDGNLWMASMGSQNPLAPGTPAPVYDFEDADSALVVYPGGSPDGFVVYTDFLKTPSPFHNTFDVTTDDDGYIYVSNMGHGQDPSDSGYMCSSVYKFTFNGTTIEEVAHWQSTENESLRQVFIDVANDEVLVGAIVTNRIIRLKRNDLSPVTDATGTAQSYTDKINSPWGVMVDNAGTIFSAAFGQKGFRTYEDLGIDGPFGVTVIKKGVSQFMTVPTGGNEVMLANGKPLYGTRYLSENPKTKEPILDPVTKQPITIAVNTPCYEPIMRLTASNTDRAGNLWTVNNWKPQAYTDIKSDPGGDGAVIFVGVAAPAK